MIHRNSLALGLLSLLAAGCNSLGGVPEFTAGAVTPPQLQGGGTALVTIDVKDKNAIVHSVVGTIKEDPSLKLKLQDDGLEGDVKAGDGIWSRAITLPTDAPAGTFNVAFTAFRKDGVAVPIRSSAGEITPLTMDLSLTITPVQ